MCPATLETTSALPGSDHQLQAYMRERAKVKLGRFASHIQSLKIRLKAMANPGGEGWVACCITIDLRHGLPLVIERSARVAWEAVDHSMGVAERAVRQVLQKRRHKVA